MGKNLGTYPLKISIIDPKTGKMTPEFERTFRDMWTQINGAAKVVGVYVAQSESVIIPKNTLNIGSNIDITAEYGDLVAAGNISVHFGAEQLCSFAFAGVPNCKMIIRASIILAAGPLGCFSVSSFADSGNHAGAQVDAFTVPDLTQDITVSIDHGNSSNFMAVKTYS